MDRAISSPRRQPTWQSTESVLHILEQVSELTLEASSPGNLSQPEQFQTPQVRKRSLSFVVTPPRAHSRVHSVWYDGDCDTKTPLSFVIRTRGLPLLPDSQTLDDSEPILMVNRHRPLHSPLQGFGSSANTDFFGRLDAFSESSATIFPRRRTVLANPNLTNPSRLASTTTTVPRMPLAPTIAATFPALEDDDAIRPRGGGDAALVASRALKMRRCSRESRSVLEAEL